MTSTDAGELLPSSVVIRRSYWDRAQIICIVLSWCSLVLPFVLILCRWWHVEVSFWLEAGATLLLAGAVGYGTNYIAIQMLFQPVDQSERYHWLRLITLGFWKQGLIPERRAILGQEIGGVVAVDLLPPKTLAEEIAKVLESALDDPAVREQLKADIEPVVRQALPAIIARLMPEIQSLLGEAIEESLSQERLLEFVERVLEPWLHDEGTRDQIAERFVEMIKSYAPSLVTQLKHVVDDQRAKSWKKKLAVSVAEWVGLIDWQEIEGEIKGRIASKETRRDLVAALLSVGPHLRKALDEADGLDKLIDTVRARVRSYGRQAVHAYLSRKLPHAVNRLLDNEALWSWLQTDGLDLLKQELVPWLHEHGEQMIGRHFNIADQVHRAISQMDVRRLNQQVNQVAAEHLGAIQVLGYIIGLLSGVLLLLI